MTPTPIDAENWLRLQGSFGAQADTLARAIGIKRPAASMRLRRMAKAGVARRVGPHRKAVVYIHIDNLFNVHPAPSANKTKDTP